MKPLARSYIWWPKMDVEIEITIKLCTICKENQPSPPSAPLHPREGPEQPWSQLHIDFAGPYMGHMFLILLDSHLKWLDAHIMHNITSFRTIEKLRQIFSIHGLPRKIVTDNGSSFTSDDFKRFLEANGIKHVTLAPYHPSTNGLAERAVQIVKRGLRCIQSSSIKKIV